MSPDYDPNWANERAPETCRPARYSCPTSTTRRSRMKKIPTLFERDSNDRRHVTPERNPAALWVGGGPAIATRLIRHADAENLGDVPTGYEELREYLADFRGEGIVWHHPDGRMAKLKKRDFPSP